MANIFLFVVVLLSLASESDSFGRPSSPVHRNGNICQQMVVRGSPLVLFSGADIEQNISTEEDSTGSGDDHEKDAVVKALGPTSIDTKQVNEANPSMTTGDESKQVFMITRDMKRIMVEELGYRRAEVDTIRVELVAEIIESRIRCPSEGMPIEWIDREREAMNESIQETSSDSMMKRLENESKYPLKFPLLTVSLILFGKGFTDALIKIIKVNIDFPGASLTEQFLGVPVLAIDLICVVLGASIGQWTWKTMK